MNKLITFLKWQQENWQRIMNQSEYGFIAKENIDNILADETDSPLKEYTAEDMIGFAEYCDNKDYRQYPDGSGKWTYMGYLPELTTSELLKEYINTIK